MRKVGRKVVGVVPGKAARVAGWIVALVGISIPFVLFAGCAIAIVKA